MGFTRTIEQGWPASPEDDFASVLKRLIEAVGCSQYRLAEVSDVDRPYLHRLSSGEKRAPSRQTAIRLGAGLVRLGADILAVDELLLAAGYAPIFAFAGVVYQIGGPEKTPKGVHRSRTRQDR